MVFETTASTIPPPRPAGVLCHVLPGSGTGTESTADAYSVQMDDEALIAEAQRGDSDAFGVLVVRYQDHLYTMAVRLLGSPADAADVVQETFTRAFTHVHDLRGLTVRNWLFRVATNCARDVQRRRMRKPTTPLDDEGGNVIALPDPALGPEADALARERMAAIRDALAELAPEHREVVVLRDVNDLTYDDIAAVLRCPIGTVRSRLSRGRAQLAARLKPSPVLDVTTEGHA